MGAPSAGNGVISESQAGELREIIKSQPDAMVAMANFKKRFEVGRIKDLPSDQYNTACTWAKLLNESDDTASSPAEENDPFA